MAKRKINFGFGAHEPIMHRLRTGNANAQEWERWHREETDENLDLIAASGASYVQISCGKGFGLEAEKWVIERAARISEGCHKRGLLVSIYTQGLPVYYEEFLREKPEAVAWLARNQSGEFIPWGSQIFRRWMSHHSNEFLEYQKHLLAYCIKMVSPDEVFIDNTTQQAWPNLDYSEMAMKAWKEYLQKKFQGQDPFPIFGIRSFDAVDLPRFDPVYFPPDAIRVVKDSLLQEYCLFRGEVFNYWISEMAKAAKALKPGLEMGTSLGCDVWRYNGLFIHGTNQDTAITVMDHSGYEESGWRPSVIFSAKPKTDVVMDERNPLGTLASVGNEKEVRVSTDARTHKIFQNFGLKNGFGFWGETDQVSQEICAAHGMTFATNGFDFGPLGPLAFSQDAIVNIQKMLQWAESKTEILTGRDDRLATIAVWRSTATAAYVRHTPIWAACAMEQLLFESHLPFTILLDSHLKTRLQRSRVLVLPLSSCVSDEQIDLISQYVLKGGNLLLLGDAGMRDEHTLTRPQHGFDQLFPKGALQGMERIGPPHYVPEPDVSKLKTIIRAESGRGRVSLVPKMPPIRDLDLTRDPYMPQRGVMPKDVLPPKNEIEILKEIAWLLNENMGIRVEGPKTTLSEYYMLGKELLICCANLLPDSDGGPIRIHLPGITAEKAEVYSYPDSKINTAKIEKGVLDLPTCQRFVAIKIK